MNKIFNRSIMALLLCGLLLGGCQSTALTPVPATVTAAPAKTPTALDEDRIRITKYAQNYTAFKIELQGGATIIADPYMMDEQVHADVVTESHQHSDHTDVSHIVEPYELLNGPGAFEFAGVKITGISGAHNKPEMNPYNYLVDNTNIIFVFDLGDIRLAQFGSQGQMPTPAMFAQIGKVDVLIIQVFTNPSTKLNMLEAQEIARTLSARIIIPAHGDSGLGEAFAQRIGADFRSEPSGVLNISRNDLDQLKTPVVVILDH